jgi:uncharacterized protein with HEPN domain
LPSSNPSLTFGDIVENIDSIVSYTTGMTQVGFSKDQKTIDATERCLARISEAAVKLGDDAQSYAPGPQWSDIRGLGNHLRHNYRRVRLEDIWKIVSEDLAPLREACVTAQSKLSSSNG